MFHRAPERVFMMAAEPKRHMRFLDRLGFHGNIVKIPKLAMKAGRRFRPQKLHHLDRFGESGHSFFARVTKNFFMRTQMAAAKADADGDGYTVAQGDCNDLNNEVNPGQIAAQERQHLGDFSSAAKSEKLSPLCVPDAADAQPI